MEKTANTINFIIEVLSKYKNLMFTTASKLEAEKRHQFMIDYLHHE